jgi:hypothetical protein
MHEQSPVTADPSALHEVCRAQVIVRRPAVGRLSAAVRPAQRLAVTEARAWPALDWIWTLMWLKFDSRIYRRVGRRSRCVFIHGPTLLPPPRWLLLSRSAARPARSPRPALVR